MTIGKVVADAFARTWEMYRNAINDIPEEQWRTGDIDLLIPARLAYHVFEAAEYYSGKTPKGFKWGHRFGADWEGSTPEQLPTRDQAREYLDEVQARVDTWLNGMDDSEMLSTGNEFSWTGSTFLSRALYLLQHNRQHVGELNAELRRRGLPRTKWRQMDANFNKIQWQGGEANEDREQAENQ